MPSANAADSTYRPAGEQPEADLFNRRMRQFLAGVVGGGVSEDQITPEFLDENIKKKKREELAKARAAGKLILSTAEVRELAERFKARIKTLEDSPEP